MELLSRYSNPSISVQRLTEVWLAAANNVTSERPPALGPRQTRLKAPDVDRLIEAYRGGALVKDLASEFSLHRTPVTLVLRRAGVDLRPVGLSDKQVVRAGQLYASGWTLAKLGVKYDVDDMTIWRSLKKIGVVMRSPNARQKKQL